MQFGTFVWPNEPECLNITFRREVTVTANAASGRWTVENPAQLPREIVGEGAFYGPDAYDKFSQLAELCNAGQAQTLTLAHWGQCSALLTELVLTEDATENYLHYAFTFIEMP